ncbi:MAG: hypothetical protein KKC55_16755 [Gammaproteobacteria bacterium]|uniref:Putative head tail connector protein n=1 Tax=viral metagenome TaxID=1070528 RepID=A0A6M3M634_9ZZZZ|nr:hypothetical protein [Gammaproteobacteria bacterium]
MGLREDIQTELAEAFDTDLADAVVPFSGGITLPGTWGPVEETSTDPVVIAYTGRGVMDAFKSQAVDGINILATDQLLIALTNETTGTPAVGHTINGFSVINVQLDPCGAHYEIQLRKT